jgi:hypothetical protein
MHMAYPRKRRLLVLVLAAGATVVLIIVGINLYLERRAAEQARDLLVGKWELVGDVPRGLEFRADGTLRLAKAYQLSVEGTYTWNDSRTLHVSFQGEYKETLASVTVSEQRLSLRPPEAGADAMVWQRVQQFSEALDHPNGKSSERQRAWLVGSWQGAVAHSRLGEVPQRFDFLADGTFGRLTADGGMFGSKKAKVTLGTYRFLPQTDNLLELTYPDSGRTETVFVRVSQDELVLRDGNSDKPVLVKHQRVQDERPELKPPADGVRSAAALYRDFKKDPAAAARQFADKRLKVAGVLGGNMIMSNAYVYVSLQTGEHDRVRCVFADPAAVQKLWRKHGMDDFGVYVVLEGKCVGLVREKVDTKMFELLSGLKFEETDSPPLLRFEGCRLLEWRPVLLPGQIVPRRDRVAAGWDDEPRQRRQKKE